MTQHGVPLTLGAVGLLFAAGVIRRRRGSHNQKLCSCPCPCTESNSKPQHYVGIDHLKRPLKDYLDLAEQDKSFARWLKRVDDEVLFWTMGQGVRDLEPRAWRKAYNEKDSPLDAVNHLVGDTRDPSSMLMAQLERTQ